MIHRREITWGKFVRLCKHRRQNEWTYVLHNCHIKGQAHKVGECSREACPVWKRLKKVAEASE